MCGTVVPVIVAAVVSGVKVSTLFSLEFCNIEDFKWNLLQRKLYLDCFREHRLGFLYSQLYVSCKKGNMKFTSFYFSVDYFSLCGVVVHQNHRIQFSRNPLKATQTS